MTPVHTAMARLAGIECLKLMPYQKSRVSLTNMYVAKERIHVRTTTEID